MSLCFNVCYDLIMTMVRRNIDRLSVYDFKGELRSTIKMLERFCAQYEEFQSIELSYEDNTFTLYGMRPETDAERAESERYLQEQKKRLDDTEYANFLRLKKKFEDA